MPESKEYIGCCGAYCKTCKPFIERFCKGCKLGYCDGARDLSRARCRIKVCCLGEKKLQTCADCDTYGQCGIIGEFYGRNGTKYRKYRQSIEFIRQNGYDKFVERAAGWKNAYGKLD